MELIGQDVNPDKNLIGEVIVPDEKLQTFEGDSLVIPTDFTIGKNAAFESASLLIVDGDLMLCIGSNLECTTLTVAGHVYGNGAIFCEEAFIGGNISGSTSMNAVCGVHTGLLLDN